MGTQPDQELCTRNICPICVQLRAENSMGTQPDQKLYTRSICPICAQLRERPGSNVGVTPCWHPKVGEIYNRIGAQGRPFLGQFARITAADGMGAPPCRFVGWLRANDPSYTWGIYKEVWQFLGPVVVEI